MSTTEFITKMAPLAVADMRKSGVLASVTLAQAILESGWGTSELAVNAFNFFGMKASLSGNTWPSAWDGATYTKDTGEQKESGEYYTVTAAFRKYLDAAASVADHSAYLTGAMKDGKKRYAGLAGEKDARKAITIIKEGGYATSLDYVEKVMNIINRYRLTAYDAGKEEVKGMKAIKIMLDAGHYGKYNRSPANAAYYESDFAWKFHLLLKAALEYRGFTVGTTRDAQAKDLDLSTRGRKAAGYDLFISIHSNAVGSGVNNSVDYSVAITMVNDDKTTIDEVSKAVGERLAQAVAQVMQTKQQARTYTKQSSNDRDGNGIFDDEYYGVLHGAKSVKVPGLILEHSFHTNAAATAWLLDDNHLQQMAEAEAAALADYYGMKQTLNQAAEEKPSVSDAAASAEAATWYRVRKSWEDSKSQLGAYRVKDNAVKNCPEGYSVFDEAGKAIYTNKAEDQAATTWYRVRKSWEDAASQVGAYKVYDNAVNNCPEGYAVFDDAGKALYRNVSVSVHEVKKGDTLGQLAKQYGTTVDAIVAANKEKYPKITADHIVVGWKLKV